MSDTSPSPVRFENPCPFRFTREQYYRLGELGFFGQQKVELLSGDVFEKYPDERGDRGSRPFRFTREQYYRIGELGFFDGRRVELAYGELVVMAPVSERHVACVSLTADLLKSTFGVRRYVRVQAPLNLAIIDPQPDVAVVDGGPRDYLVTPTIALLIVEVADTTLVYDLVTKTGLYATAGIADYWVLDVENRQLHVFRDPTPLAENLEATTYRTHFTLAPTDRVSPLAASNASVLVSDLLP